MIVRSLIIRNCQITAGKSIARIAKEGVAIEGEGGALILEAFELEITASPWAHPQFVTLEVQQLGVDYAKEQGHYVELDCGGETHNDDDEGEAWKRG